MYLRTLKYVGLKRLRDTYKTPLDFTRAGEPRMWTVLLGANGTCKTTLLQAIALAGVGVPTADQLAQRVRKRLQDIMRPNVTVKIEAEFGFDPAFHAERRYPGLDGLSLPAPPRLRSEINLAKGKRSWSGDSWYIAPEGVDPALKARIEGVKNPLSMARSEERMPFWLVAGYGVQRDLPDAGTAQQAFDPVLDRLRPLFGDRTLTATGFVEDDKIRSPDYLRMLEEALTREPGLAQELDKVERRGAPAKHMAGQRLIDEPKFFMPFGKTKRKLRATWLSQGYQSMIAWIADLIGHGLLDSIELTGSTAQYIDPRELSGLVLIDEVDLYLHPKWQVDVIAALKATFPRIQFVATTHSPMVLPGLREGEVRGLHIGEDGRVGVEVFDDDPRLKTGSELYSAFFGVNGLYPADLARKARAYRRVAANPFRDDADDARMQALAAELDRDDIAVAPAVARRSR